MEQVRQHFRSALALAVVGAALTFSVASGPTEPDESICGALEEERAAEGDTCEDRDDCNEVCCLCDNNEFGYVAFGCEPDEGVCLGGNELCRLTLQDDPSLCGSADAGP